MVATILVVDDEKNIRRALRMVLEGSGFHTLEAGSAEDCLETLDSYEVDLVILDVRLPKMSGIEALSKIRKKPATRRLPVLMVSGHASLAEAVQAVQLGATDFFEKPLDRDRVLVTVRNALKTWQLQREVEQLRADAEHRYEMIGESPCNTRALCAAREDRAYHRTCSHRRRERDGQGAGRARHPPTQPASRGSVHQGQLRGDSGRADRE